MNRAALNVTATDLDLGAKTVAGEARGETLGGQQAVAWVIINRVRADLHGDGKPDWWGEGISGVCLKKNKAGKYQFSCWNEGDPNRAYIEKLTAADTEYQWALYALLGAVTALVHDATCGSTHYHSLNADPAWAIGVTPVASIGRHRFYDNIA